MNNEAWYKEQLLNQQRIINDQQKKINKLSLKTKVNPYTLFNIPKDYTILELKKAYIKKAFEYHPDKTNNDPQKSNKFKLYTKIYHRLLEKKKNNENDKDHNDLKKESNEYIDKQIDQSKLLDVKKFNIDTFNEIYTNNKLNDHFFDNGYGEWLQSNEDIDNINTNVNEKNFDEVFNQLKKSKSKNYEIQKYKHPEAISIYSNSDQLVNLGLEKQDDYTGSTGNLHYQDIKKAYNDTLLIDINSIDLSKRDNNINDYNNSRKNISYELSKDEENYMKTEMKVNKYNEELRLLNIKKRDEQISNKYEELHGRLLGRW